MKIKLKRTDKKEDKQKKKTSANSDGLILLPDSDGPIPLP